MGVTRNPPFLTPCQVWQVDLDLDLSTQLLRHLAQAQCPRPAGETGRSHNPPGANPEPGRRAGDQVPDPMGDERRASGGDIRRGGDLQRGAEVGRRGARGGADEAAVRGGGEGPTERCYAFRGCNNFSFLHAVLFCPFHICVSLLSIFFWYLE